MIILDSCENILHIFCFFIRLEPNNDSPLNVNAAELWPNQEVYKKVLLEKYQSTKSQNSFVWFLPQIVTTI